MKLIIPVRKTVWGEIDSLSTFKVHVARSGQFFYEDKSGPACNYDRTLSCSLSFYQAIGLKGHGGIDVPSGLGTPVYASHDGVVFEAQDYGPAGIGVVIFNPQERFKTLYWHLKSFTVKHGDPVKAGDLIGYVNNTGYSSGNHLHFGLKRTDNLGNTINFDNGYRGSIDPLPYLIHWEQEMLTREQVIKQYLIARRVYPTDSEVDYWTGKSLDDLQNQMLKDDKKLLEEGVK